MENTKIKRKDMTAETAVGIINNILDSNNKYIDLVYGGVRFTEVEGELKDLTVADNLVSCGFCIYGDPDFLNALNNLEEALKKRNILLKSESDKYFKYLRINAYSRKNGEKIKDEIFNTAKNFTEKKKNKMFYDCCSEKETVLRSTVGMFCLDSSSYKRLKKFYSSMYHSILGDIVNRFNIKRGFLKEPSCYAVDYYIDISKNVKFSVSQRLIKIDGELEYFFKEFRLFDKRAGILRVWDFIPEDFGEYGVKLNIPKNQSTDF